jgi:hypothetical protein
LDERSGGILGTVASIVAGVVILHVLWIIYSEGLDNLLKTPYIYELVLLVIIGVFAYIGYINYAKQAKWHMTYLSPIALLFGAIAVPIGYKYGALMGGGLIIIAYLIELTVGLKLFKDFQKETGLGALLFLAGVTVFMIFLPVILYTLVAALISFAGDFVKIIGLTLILWKMLAGKGEQ